MAKDVEKRHLIASQLVVFPSLDAEFFCAIEGKKLTSQELSKLANFETFKNRYGSFATLAALGCSISHKLVYNQITEDNQHTFALILEDDALLGADLEHCISSISPILNTDQPMAILLTPDFFFYNKNLIEVNGYHLAKVSSGYMTSGYLINKAGAKILQSVQSPVSFLADAWQVFIDHGLTLYGVTPHVISYPDGLGEIGLSQLTQKKSLFHQIWNWGGRCKGRLSYSIKYIRGLRKSKKLW